MSFDRGDHVPHAEVAIIPCDKTEAAGLYLASLAAKAGLTSELVTFVPEETEEDRTLHLKVVNPDQYVTVQCGDEDCDASLNAAAAKTIGGEEPSVFQSEHFTAAMVPGQQDWTGRAPLEVVHLVPGSVYTELLP